MSKLTLGINQVSNRDYHADKEYLSSSDLKTLLKDPSKFYNEKILGLKEPQKENAHYDIGSLVHSLILEPHLVQEEFAFFGGLRKQGPLFESFKQMYPDKIIISRPQRLKCEYYVAGYKRRPEAKKLIKGGFSEHTICVDMDGVKIKVRCDYINVDKGYIADVKTTGFSVERDSFKVTCDQYMYQLSGALYAKAAEIYYGKPFDFYFIAISKMDGECQVYKLSEESKQRGLLQINQALEKYKACLKSGIWTDQQKADLFDTEYEILEI